MEAATNCSMVADTGATIISSMVAESTARYPKKMKYRPCTKRVSSSAGMTARGMSGDCTGPLSCGGVIGGGAAASIMSDIVVGQFALQQFPQLELLDLLLQQVHQL